MTGTEMDVLLFSPVAGRDPASGDIAYTQALLADPPPGVRYTTYAEALDSGRLRIRGTRARASASASELLSGSAPADLGILLARAGELALRRGGVMYREPTWFVSADPSFDLIHQHLFAVRQVGPGRVPVVSSAGMPLPVLYAVREGWGRERLRAATWLEAAWAGGAAVDNPWLRGSRDSVMTVYTEHFRRWLLARQRPGIEVRLAGTGLPARGGRAQAARSGPVEPAGERPLRLAFVGRDFHRKGGDVAVEAWRRLVAGGTRAELTVVTSAADAPAAEPGLLVLCDAPHDQVVDDVLPRIDVLVAPTRSDCGATYAMLEALRAGCVVVTSTIPWLDERLAGPGVRRVPADAAAVSACLAELADPGVLAAGRAAACRLWQDEFSMPVLHRALLDAYERALASSRPWPATGTRRR